MELYVRNLRHVLDRMPQAGPVETGTVNAGKHAVPAR